MHTSCGSEVKYHVQQMHLAPPQKHSYMRLTKRMLYECKRQRGKLIVHATQAISVRFATDGGNKRTANMKYFNVRSPNHPIGKKLC